MSQTISRIYDSREAALRAAASLKSENFRHVNVVSAPAAPAPVAEGEEAPATAPSTEDLAASIAKGNVAKAEAEVYAKRVAEGGTLVSVEAPFGSAARAIALLNMHGPVKLGAGVAQAPSTGSAPAASSASTTSWHEAAPLSNALGLPVLSSDPAPLSTFLNMSTLSSNAAPLSSALGWGLLSKESAPLSSALGLSTLSSNAAPLSSALGLPVLSSDPAPLSSSLGLPLLSHNPTPLSSWLNLAVLTKGRPTY